MQFSEKHGTVVLLVANAIRCAIEDCLAVTNLNDQEVTMADIDYSPLEDAVLTLEDEDGNETEVTMQCIFEYDDQDYAAMIEEDEEEPSVYFFSLHAKKTKKKEVEFEFTPVEDDDLLEDLLDIFQQIINEEAEDEDEGLEGISIDGGEQDSDDDEDDDDDSKWDQFINKKLD